MIEKRNTIKEIHLAVAIICILLIGSLLTQSLSTFFIKQSVAEGSKPNLIENSSFEVGTGHGWGLSGNVQFPLSSTMIDGTTAVHGTKSVKLPYDTNYNAQKLISKIYKVRSSTDHTLSLYMKSNLNNGAIRVRLENTNQADGSFDYKEASFNLTTDWQRYSLSGNLVADPEATYQVEIIPQHQGYPGKSVWVDAVRLEEGSLSDYNPSSDVELGLSSSHDGNLFYEDEAASMQLFHYNNSQAVEVKTKYEVYDYYNKKIKSGELNSSLAGQSLTTTNLDLSPNKRGAFRAILWLEGYPDTIEEVNYSVIPRSQTAAVNENSIFGSHVPFYDYWLAQMQKVGVKWNRSLSTGQEMFRWYYVEPTDNSFVWQDSKVAKPAQYGMKIMGTIGSEVAHIPTWALPKGTSDVSQWDDESFNGFLAKWDDYVYQVVNHYKNNVDYWEIWNEPDTEGGLGSYPQYYAKILQTAHDAAKRADPDTHIVGMVAYYTNYVQSVLDTIGNNYADIWSSHRYPPMNSSHTPGYLSLASSSNKDAWNSETGARTDTFYQSLLWENLDISYARPSDWGRDYRKRTEWQVQNFAESIGAGFKKYFYYDARNTTSPDFLISYSLFEYDGTLRPKGVAYSVLAKLFDGSVGQGEVNLGTNVKAYLFNRLATPLMIIYPSTDDNSKRKITLNLSSENIKAYDLMGNEVSKVVNGNSVEITFGRSPLYLEGVGINSSQLTSSIQGVAATADVQAPDISLATFPTATLATDNSDVTMRWYGTDDVSLSTRAETTANSILYSYRLVGQNNSWSSWQTQGKAVLASLPRGSYTFEVKAKDAAGNESAVLSRQIKVGLPKNYYVAKTGSDSNDGSETSPFLTIQKAANTVQAGDTVYVKEGNYDERIIPANSGTEGSKITFKNYQNDVVVTKGFTLLKDYIRVEGFEITNTLNHWRDGSGIWVQSSHSEIINNYIHHTFTNATGIRFAYQAIFGQDYGTISPIYGSIIKGNTITYAGGQGIEIHGYDILVEDNDISHPLNEDGLRFFGKNLIIRSNYIHDILLSEVPPTAHTDAFQTFDKVDNVLIEGNYVYNIGHQIMMLSGNYRGPVSNVVIKNNIFEKCGSYGFYLMAGQNLSFLNNTFIDMNFGSIITRAQNGMETTGTVIKNNLFYQSGSWTYTDNSIPAQADYNLAYPTKTWNQPPEAHGKVGIDPQLTNYANHDFHLQATSPAINAGTSDGASATDKDGNARVGTPDIGAYEYQGEVTPPTPEPEPEELPKEDPPVDNHPVNNTVDNQPPANIKIACPNHFSNTGYYKDNNPTVLFSADDVSGIAGYSYSLSKSPFSVADTVSEGIEIFKGFNGLGNGTWYFSLRAVDNNGNWSEPSTFIIKIDNSKPRTRALKKVVVKKGKIATLKYKVIDPYTDNKARVTIKIKKIVKVIIKKDRKKKAKKVWKTVKILNLRVKNINKLSDYKYRARLRKGAYRYFIYATDLACNNQHNIAGNWLVVR
ncbi:MAG: DUF1565 domain-containing protein [Actinobacteria bacterium]|nr:MAG: DUF1565 domain-containing protein [Actinomycetota bacterium]